MSTGTVEVEYIGPGSDTDKRVLNVSEAEAQRLQAKGMWKVTEEAVEPAEETPAPEPEPEPETVPRTTRKRSVNDG